MFEYLKTTQKSKSGFKNPGFHNLVEIKKDGTTIEIYGEKHNKKMIKTNIYTKIVKELRNPDYPRPLILVEHSDHPSLCQLTEEDIPKFTEQIQYSGSELIFFELINDPLMKEHLVCVDNRISLGYLPAFKEISYSKIIYQLMEIDSKELPYVLEKILEPLQDIIVTYQTQIDTLISNKDYYQDTVLDKLYQLYSMVLSRQFYIALNILTKTNLLDNNLSADILEIPETQNYYILMRLLDTLIQNFIKISSLSVDINIYNIIEKDDKHNEILLFCGNNHCIRMTKLFFKYKGPILNQHSEEIDNFLLEDVEHADIKPIFSEEKDTILLEYLESLESKNSTNESAENESAENESAENESAEKSVSEKVYEKSAKGKKTRKHKKNTKK